MIFYLIYKLGSFVFLHLPLKLGYRLAVFLSDLHYLFAGKDRNNVAANLRAIFPHKDISEIRAIRLAMSRNFAKYLVDFFRFPLLDKKNIQKTVRPVNLHYLDQGLSKGKGVIILSAHLGNWELGGALLALLGYQIGAVVLPHRHKSVDNFFNSQRQKKGEEVIPIGRAVYRCLKMLSENKIVALVGDRVFNTRGVLVDFFGRPSRLPRGPAAFSLNTGAVIVPTFVLRDPDDTFRMVFEKPIEYQPCADKERDLVQLTAECGAIIEDYVRRYPEQWFMFRRFWV